ncbi:MAG: single-stranded-DNA-specific exonuclease RecJ [Lachnospiraceae bacterium]|nr:single-stranded-DNA-specific exonuclease RecJ [Lachnospiraceae bacterium]
MEKWSICNKTGDFEGIAKAFGLSKVSARALVNRNMTDHDDIRKYLYPDISAFYPPHLITGLMDAARVLADKIALGMKIRIVGDYDVDGIMATYILTDAIAACKGSVDWYIPHRIKDGYGINAEIIRNAQDDGIDTIVTCDNGIAAFDAADEARRLGITMIVTDHHEIQSRLPDCDIVIDPKREDDHYPCKDICGAVVASKLAEALFDECGIPYEPDIYLEVKAMATICDVVPLLDENRAIAKLGIRKLAHTANPGLAALIAERVSDPENLSDYHVGFLLGPCFNATGRIDDAGVALGMLMEKDPVQARQMALTCIRLNEERKSMTAQEEEKALDIINSWETLPNVIVVELKTCHESILGIIAGRLKEHYMRPVIAVTRTNDGYKGSGRSIEGYNIFEKISACEDLLIRFGGHPMAAGMTIKEGCLAEFAERLNRDCGLKPEDMCRKLLLDAEVDFCVFNDRTVDELGLFAPFGTGNPSLLFAQRGLKARQLSYIGKDLNYLKLILESPSGQVITATLFSNAGAAVEKMKEKYGEQAVKDAFAGRPNNIELTAAFVPKINTFREKREVQMNIKALKW